jgi:hypothetical protein
MIGRTAWAFLVFFPALASSADRDFARRPRAVESRWSSFENVSAAKGQGGMENHGAKGHAFDSLRPGETKVLLNVKGAGEIRSMWFTMKERNTKMLQELRLELFWDGAATPAVSVPFGDFFGAILGRAVPFENELFSDPEGRSFNCYIPMPFRKGARVTLTNDPTRALPLLFYDINFLSLAQPDQDALYFHASWRRERGTTLGRDFEILPTVRGVGRFLGTHVGVIVHPDNTGWWGEGEVKMYLDGDHEWPTIVGTGAEDYIGTGWGEAVFRNRFQGSMIADKDAGQYAFYRYHVPDPIYFQRDIRVTIQQMGGDSKSNILSAMRKGVPMIPVSVAKDGRFVKLMDESVPLDKDPSPEDAWTNVYRRDDWSAVALFYLDSPENSLPSIAGVAQRTAGLESAPAK